MKKQIIGVIQSLSPASEEITIGMNLKEDLGFDSLRLAELIITLEETAGVEFEESDLNPAKLITVGDVNSLLERYL